MSDNKPNHLNNLTLILNASYLPLGVCNSKRAICLSTLSKKYKHIARLELQTPRGK